MTEIIGTSVLGEPIYVLKIGNGPKKILMWSQMHGNESTTTKAVFDLCNLLASNDASIEIILKNCTIAIVPMLNPDGAKAYTRTNANGVDLNRDAQDLFQPESVALKGFFNAFKPNVCFNLHGQRTIFSAGSLKYPATISFLAPAQDETCSITPTRKKAMEVIVEMNGNLQIQIPNQVGIYDDAFNINCVGDTFQSLNIPTVLFEAGHFDNDYNREVVREFIFQSLVVAINHIANFELTGKGHKLYTDIPQNQKLFYDIIIRNTMIDGEKCDVAIQYQEKLIDGDIKFKPMVEKISDLQGYFGHREVDAKQKEILTHNHKNIYEGYENDFVLIEGEIISFKR